MAKVGTVVYQCQKCGAKLRNITVPDAETARRILAGKEKTPWEWGVQLMREITHWGDGCGGTAVYVKVE